MLQAGGRKQPEKNTQVVFVFLFEQAEREGRINIRKEERDECRYVCCV